MYRLYIFIALMISLNTYAAVEEVKNSKVEKAELTKEEKEIISFFYTSFISYSIGSSTKF